MRYRTLFLSIGGVSVSRCVLSSHVSVFGAGVVLGVSVSPWRCASTGSSVWWCCVFLWEEGWSSRFLLLFLGVSWLGWHFCCCLWLRRMSRQCFQSYWFLLRLFLWWLLLLPFFRWFWLLSIFSGDDFGGCFASFLIFIVWWFRWGGGGVGVGWSVACVLYHDPDWFIIVSNVSVLPGGC